MRPVSRPVRGGLAPWQERRAKEILRANLHGVPLKKVARECGLSVGYFSHAFRRALGVAPHKWLIEQRVVLSKQKLRDDGLSLSDVAKSRLSTSRFASQRTPPIECYGTSICPLENCSLSSNRTHDGAISWIKTTLARERHLR